MHASNADPQGLGDRPYALALCIQRLDLIGLRFGDPLALALQHHGPFKLGDAAQDGPHHLASGSRGIEAVVQDAEGDTFGLSRVTISSRLTKEAL